MHLYFSGVSGPFAPEQAVERIRFDTKGGMIGRAPECVMVLDDGERHVSRHHVQIEWAQEAFHLRVVSEINPIKINGDEYAHDARVTLQDDDTVEIGPFKLHAHIVKPTVSAGAKLKAAENPAPADLGHAVHCLGQGMKYPLRLSPEVSLEHFLKNYGEVTAELLEGARKLTALRAESKSEYVPTDRTMVAKVDTNPIKHASSRLDLFKMMFPEQGPNELIDPVESVREVMNDLRLHEAAMQAGMRSAMQAILSELDPAKLEADTSGFLFNLAAGKAMAAYKQRFNELRDAIGRGKSSDIWEAFREGYRSEVTMHKAKGNPGNRS